MTAATIRNTALEFRLESKIEFSLEFVEEGTASNRGDGSDTSSGRMIASGFIIQPLGLRRCPLMSGKHPT